MDYDYQDIGTEKFLLPYTSTVTMRDGQLASKNDIRWQKYQKYSADSRMIYDDTDTTDQKK